MVIKLGVLSKFKMEKHMPMNLVEMFTRRYGLKKSSNVSLIEVLIIFLHKLNNRMIQEKFWHSGKFVSRWFKKVLVY